MLSVPWISHLRRVLSELMKSIISCFIQIKQIHTIIFFLFLTLYLLKIDKTLNDNLQRNARTTLSSFIDPKINLQNQNIIRLSTIKLLIEYILDLNLLILTNIVIRWKIETLP